MKNNRDPVYNQEILKKKKEFNLILTKRWQQSQINIYDDYRSPNWW